MTKRWTLVALVLIPFALASAAAGAGQSRPNSVPAARFIVVGDTGTGDERARRVAEQIRGHRRAGPCVARLSARRQRVRAWRSALHQHQVSLCLPRGRRGWSPDPCSTRQSRRGAMPGIGREAGSPR